MNKATFVKNLDWKSDARLYKCEPAFTDIKYDYDEDVEKEVSYEYVIVSAVIAMFSGAETYIFPATSDGKAIDMLELNGSFNGDLDHVQALRNAGYEVA